MKYIRGFLLSLALVFASTGILISGVFAAEGGGCSFSATDGESTATSIKNYIQNCKPDATISANNDSSSGRLPGYSKVIDVINRIIQIGGIIAIGGIVYSAFQFVLSFGDSGKIKNAKDALQYSVIGFVAIILAQSLVNIVVNFLFSLGS